MAKTDSIRKAEASKTSALRTLLKESPPNVFIGGLVPNPPGFPLKACGNDGLRRGNSFNAPSCGEIDPQRLNQNSDSAEKPKNASTRVSMNGNILNDFDGSSVRSFD
jgi:hypothetical protein